MAESFAIQIPETIDKKMAVWKLPTELLDTALAKRRADLAADPSQRLRPVVAPWGQRLNLYSFRLPDPTDSSTNHIFMFHLVFGQDESTLVVVECGHIAHTRPTP